MAVVFYWKETGTIYGVHPDTNIAVPAGVAHLDVPNPPAKVEQMYRVVNGALEALPAVTDPKQTLRDQLASATTITQVTAVLMELLK